MTALEINRSQRVRRLSVNGDPITIGRSRRNDIVLSDTTVSRRHCVIEVLEGAARIRDLGSRHGFRVNGRVSRESPLADGDCIRIGPFEIVFVDPLAEKSLTPEDLELLHAPEAPDGAAGSGTGSAADDVATVTVDLAERQRDADVLAAQRDELEARRREIDEEHGRRTDELDRREAALVERDREITEREEARARGDDDLAVQNRRLDESLAALDDELGRARKEHAEAVTHRDEELRRTRSEHDELIRRTHAEHAKEQSRRDAEAAEAASAIEAAHRRIRELEGRVGALDTELAEKRRMLEESMEAMQRSQREREELWTRLDEADATVASLRQHEKKFRKDLTATSTRLERITERAEDLKRHNGALEREGRQWRQRTEIAARSLAQIDAGMGRLHVLGNGLSRVLHAVRALEVLWVETNDWVEEADDDRPDTLEQVLAQREDVGARLETAHRERDARLDELLAIVERFCRAADAEREQRQALLPESEEGNGVVKVRRRSLFRT